MAQDTTEEACVDEIETPVETSFAWAEKWLPVFAAGFFTILLGVYFYHFRGELGDNNAFGTFGDFVGGALNPILGFFTVWLLIKSIRFQIQELAATRAELKRATNASEATAKIQQDNLANEKSMFIKHKRLHQETIESQTRIMATEQFAFELTMMKEHIEAIISKPRFNHKGHMKVYTLFDMINKIDLFEEMMRDKRPAENLFPNGLTHAIFQLQVRAIMIELQLKLLTLNQILKCLKQQKVNQNLFIGRFYYFNRFLLLLDKFNQSYRAEDSVYLSKEQSFDEMGITISALLERTFYT
jgi:hypothetical protein